MRIRASWPRFIQVCRTTKEPRATHMTKNDETKEAGTTAALSNWIQVEVSFAEPSSEGG